MIPTCTGSVLLSILLLACYLGNQVSAWTWSYNDNGRDGPSNWGLVNSQCDLKRQSPIAIQTDKTVSSSLGEFIFSDGYFTVDDYHVIMNNGHTVQLDMKVKDKTISGGGLDSTYRLVQLHMHWGRDDQVGSEHIVDGKAYPLEIHLVHYDKVNHPNVSEALKSGTGLAVLGVMAKIGQKGNRAMQQIVNSLSSVSHADESSNFTDTFSLIDLLPFNHDNFFRYLGSLTTPPCSESVVWTVFQKPIEVTAAQMNELRQLNHNRRGEHGDKLVDNFRPLQNLNGREVKRSFMISKDIMSGCEGRVSIIVPVIMVVLARLFKLV